MYMTIFYLYPKFENSILFSLEVIVISKETIKVSATQNLFFLITQYVKNICREYRVIILQYIKFLPQKP